MVYNKGPCRQMNGWLAGWLFGWLVGWLGSHSLTHSLARWLTQSFNTAAVAGASSSNVDGDDIIIIIRWDG